MRYISFVMFLMASPAFAAFGEDLFVHEYNSDINSKGLFDPVEIEVPQNAVSLTAVLLGSPHSIVSIKSIVASTGESLWSQKDATRAVATAYISSPLNENLGPGRYKIFVSENSESGSMSGRLKLKVIIKSGPATLVNKKARLKLNFYFSGTQGWTAANALENQSFVAIIQRISKVFGSFGIEVAIGDLRNVPNDFLKVNSNSVEESYLANNSKEGISIFLAEELMALWDEKDPSRGSPAAGISPLPGAALTPGTRRSGVTLNTTFIGLDDAGELDTESLGTIVCHEVCHFMGLPHYKIRNIEPYDFKEDLLERDNIMTELTLWRMVNNTLRNWQVHALKAHPCVELLQPIAISH